MLRVKPDTEIYGIIGHPLSHSLSPVIHNLAFELFGINAIYIPFETEDLTGAIYGVRALNIKGLSVTIPYKTGVLELLDDIDENAGRIGAVNTILNKHGRLTGYNTDSTGGIRALEEITTIRGKRCLIIGAGGSAMALGYGLKEKGAELYITNRTKKRGEELANRLGAEFVDIGRAVDIPIDILIQATPVGMYPHADKSPVPFKILKEGMVVMDIIYNPVETLLLKEARRHGCSTISGIHMFINQAVEQFLIWTGKPAPAEEMRNYALKQIKQGFKYG